MLEQRPTIGPSMVVNSTYILNINFKNFSEYVFLGYFNDEYFFNFIFNCMISYPVL